MLQKRVLGRLGFGHSVKFNVTFQVGVVRGSGNRNLVITVLKSKVLVVEFVIEPCFILRFVYLWQSY